jgi:hypothetical protein
MTRFPRLTAAVFGLSLLAAPMAMAESEVDAATKDKVTADLTAQGYDVRKMEMEDGMLEVYAVKDGKTLQLFLDKDLKVVKTCEGNTCEEGENG